jgi:nitrogen fixation protein NifU and related proteins
MINKKILDIALKSKNYGLKKNGSYKAKCKNRICGDVIEIELNTDKHKIKSMRYVTESCIFCEASASILSQSIKNFEINDVPNEIEKIYAFFKDNKEKLPKKFNLFRLLINNKYKNRLDCVKLPFKALSKALETH